MNNNINIMIWTNYWANKILDNKYTAHIKYIKTLDSRRVFEFDYILSKPVIIGIEISMAAQHFLRN